MTIHTFYSLIVILVHFSSLRTRMVCFLFPPPTFSTSTSWHIPCYSLPLFLSWHSIFHLKGPEILVHLTLPFFLRKALHEPHSILWSFLKTKILNIVYKSYKIWLLFPLKLPLVSASPTICALVHRFFFNYLGKKIKQTSSLHRYLHMQVSVLEVSHCTPRQRQPRKASNEVRFE